MSWILLLALLLPATSQPTTLVMPFASYGACREALAGVEAEFESAGACIAVGGEAT